MEPEKPVKWIDWGAFVRGALFFLAVVLLFTLLSGGFAAPDPERHARFDPYEQFDRDLDPYYR